MAAEPGAGKSRYERFAVVRRYSGYLTYQQRAGDRQIPVVVLEPRG